MSKAPVSWVLLDINRTTGFSARTTSVYAAYFVLLQMIIYATGYDVCFINLGSF